MNTMMARWAVVLLAGLMFVACDKKSDDDGAHGATSDSAQTSEDGKKEGASVDPKKALDEVADAAKYDKEMRKKACEILTADMVAKALEVPAGELKQVKVMGCNYSWDKDGQVAEARFGSIRVHDTTEKAERWFGNATKGMTAEDVEKTMAKVAEKAKEDERVDTDEKKKMVEGFAKMAAKSGPIEFEDIDGIGDQARMNKADGDIWVRKGNLTFIVAAYKGKEMEMPEMDPKNMKGFAAKAREADKAHKKATMPARKESARKIAEQVLSKL
jgi:hypothetical protein